MRKHLFLTLAGALALTACSSDEPSNSGTNEGNDTNQHYISVNIVSTPSSRAAGDQTVGDPDNNATYEEGLANENKVSHVRFYFFNSDGSAANVKYNQAANYFDWDSEDINDDYGHDLPNVEKQLQATLVISTREGDQVPSKMVAVLNPTSDFLQNQSGKALSLLQLRQITRDYASLANNTSAPKFVMFNSAYANANRSEAIFSTTIPASSYQPSADLALANPVNIYVERNVAKIRVRFNEEFATIANNGTVEKIALKDKDGKNILINGKQVYLQALNWGVTAETDIAYLGKYIATANPNGTGAVTWAANLFGASEQWNYTPYFRSFWAGNPAAAKKDYHDFNSIEIKNFKSAYTYTNENAPQISATSEDVAGGNVEQFTKVIIAGQLVDADGNAIELCKYAGLTTAGTTNLKTLLLNQLKANGHEFYRYTETEEDGTVTKECKSMTEDDLKFVTALDANITGIDKTEGTQGRYYVYLNLDADENSKWTTVSTAKDVTEDDLHSVAEVNDYLIKQLGHSTVYRTGRTYYFFPIRHLAESGKVGYYGIVRNHIYDCVVDNIFGLGTPVFDPSQNIWPEKPKEEDTYIAAKINILSWRLVPNNVTLEW